MILVVDKIAEILDVISAGNGKEMLFKEIAEKVSINRTTCANLLKALKDIGYIEQKEARKGYTLGHRLYSLTYSSFSAKGLLEFALPLVDKLRDEINENIFIASVKEDKREILHIACSTHEVCMATKDLISVYRATTGRIILANWDMRRIESFISTFGLPSQEDWPEAVSKEALIEELGRIKALDCYETCNSVHVASMSVPIFYKGSVIASIGTHMPDIRYTEANRSLFKKKLLETAEAINRRLQ